MIEIELPGTHIRTTRIGYGCARLFRVTSSEGRQRLLHAAFDAGIRHFDVARMYGLGAAEAELGRFAQSRRDQLVIATKFGITPGAAARRLASVQAVARRAINYVPALKKLVASRTDRLYQPRDYSAKSAANSLETSLRELKTDYVDLFVLHEPTLRELAHTDVLPWLEAARTAGTIRAFGVAGSFADVTAISASLPSLSQIVQFPSDAANHNAERFHPRSDQAVITFGTFSALESQLNSEGGNSTRSAEALIRHSLNANSDGVVLFSSTRVHRIEAYCAVAKSPTEANGGAELLSGIAVRSPPIA